MLSSDATLHLDPYTYIRHAIYHTTRNLKPLNPKPLNPKSHKVNKFGVGTGLPLVWALWLQVERMVQEAEQMREADQRKKALYIYICVCVHIYIYIILLF